MRVSAIALGLAAFAASAPAHADDDLVRTASIVVVGDRAALQKTPGSAATIEADDLERARVLTVNEALRQVSGVFPRDEEGLGLRPNIGVRGLSPTRSTKVLLLEDGVPLTYAPYGDNATYSHPPIRRFSRIEVLKGSGQIRFGPNTVGGVVNYITPRAPEEFGGRLTITGGDKGYGEIDGEIGGQAFDTRMLVHGNYTQFDGIRDNHGLEIRDLYFKAERDFGADHSVTLRLGAAGEDSQVSYSGLTQAEYDADRFANPFENDRFKTQRYTGSLTDQWRLSDSLTLTTTAYSLYFNRDWWRQSSNSGQRPNDASDPLCGGMANVNTTCGTEGRLREYHHYGVESRLGWDGALAGVATNAEFGARWHTERQNRLQINADTPTGRTPGTSVNGGVSEQNRRYADALSAWATGAFTFGALTVSPGVRVESVEYERINLLTGARSESDLTEIIPGLGLNYTLNDSLSLYGGVHRGFAPPRVEDIVTNTGGVVDLDAEKSLNWEIGLRGSPKAGLSFDVAAFLLDFENQIVPSSVAGGAGATLTSAGETRHTGFEASFKGSLRDMGAMQDNDIFFRGALTWVADAEYKGTRFSSISGSNTVSVTGNRLPYSPEWIASAAIGYAIGNAFDAQLEVQYTDEQFTDDLNTVAPTTNGQRGLIEAATTFNAAANFRPGDGKLTFFGTVKNIFDEKYIVDRSRGILPGAPRLWQAGVSVSF